jgi:hypothetical protein
MHHLPGDQQQPPVHEAAGPKWPQQAPWAYFVKIYRRTRKKFLNFADRKEMAKHLKPRDLVESNMIDGDIVMFNRKPSLYRISIIAHRAEILEGRTFRLNDLIMQILTGMNLHLPQTEEARAEALVLMGDTSNLVTPRNGDLMIAVTQDCQCISLLQPSSSLRLSGKASRGSALCSGRTRTPGRLASWFLMNR